MIKIDPQKLLEENYQLIYTYKVIQEGTIMNMLHFALHHFIRSFQYRNINYLRKCVHKIELGSISEITQESEFAEVMFSSLIDSISITICFENYLKAKLLTQGYLIHQINYNKKELNEIGKTQRKKPVKFEEILKIEPLKIKSEKYYTGSSISQTSGIIEKSLNISQLLSYSDINEHLKLPESIVKRLRIYVNQRNTLHYLYKQTLPLNKNWYNEFIGLIDFINLYIIPWYNQLCRRFHPDDYSRCVAPLNVPSEL